MARTIEVEDFNLKIPTARDWLIAAMMMAQINVAQLSKRSGVSPMTIWNILNRKQKNGCREDILFLLVRGCGFTFRDFRSIIKPLS
jgi:hypothetical protein